MVGSCGESGKFETSRKADYWPKRMFFILFRRSDTIEAGFECFQHLVGEAGRGNG